MLRRDCFHCLIFSNAFSAWYIHELMPVVCILFTRITAYYNVIAILMTTVMTVYTVCQILRDDEHCSQSMLNTQRCWWWWRFAWRANVHEVKSLHSLPPPLLVHFYSATNSLFVNDDLCWATRWVHADSHWRAIKSNQIPTCSQFIPNSSSQNVTFICIGFLDLLPIPTAWILAIVKLYSHNSTKATTIITPLSTSVNGNGTEINLACSLLV